MVLLKYFFWLSLTVGLVKCYWDKDREQIENPQNDNPSCNTYCKEGLPSYMNWREAMSGTDDFRERQGISRVVASTANGPVEGISVPGMHDDSSFVNIYLGIPYAKPPVGLDMFKVGQRIQGSIWCIKLIFFI